MTLFKDRRRTYHRRTLAMVFRAEPVFWTSIAVIVACAVVAVVVVVTGRPS